MIDCHCHLENEAYSKDRKEVLERCKKELKGVITCCAHPRDFDLTMGLAKKYENFVFATVSIHPIYIKELGAKEIDGLISKIKENQDKIAGIGENGLDYFHIKEAEWRQKQKELFIKFIALAKKLKKPLIIHSRDSAEDILKILEQENAKEVYWHMFGAKKLLKKVIDNGYFIGANAIILKSKNHKKIIRDAPIEKILLETDAPWLAPDGGRNEPTAIKAVAHKIAQIKKLQFEHVWSCCGENAIEFFNLPIQI